jgi:hypothetical protein
LYFPVLRAIVDSISFWIVHGGALIGSIHPTIGAALIALVGVVLSLWWNRILQRRQHFLEFRRAVYLDACDVTAEAIQFLSMMGNPKVTLASGGQSCAKLAA